MILVIDTKIVSDVTNDTVIPVPLYLLPVLLLLKIYTDTLT